MGEQKSLVKSMVKDKLRLSKDMKYGDNHRYVKRYDYVLQERSIETFVKTVGIMQSHTSYFRTVDVAMFILMKVHKERIKIQDLQ